jgi:hypothetical protein
MVAAIGFGAASKPAEARDSFYIAYDNGPYYGSYYSGEPLLPRHNDMPRCVYSRPAYRYAYYDDPYYSRCWYRHGYRYCRPPTGASTRYY